MEDMSAEVGWAAVIVVDDAAKDIAALDRASVLGLAVGDGGALVNSLMGASDVVVAVGKLTQDPPEVGLIQDEEMIEALLSGSPNPTFREGIRIGRAKGNGDNVEAFASKDSIESVGEFGVIVADEEM